MNLTAPLETAQMINYGRRSLDAHDTLFAVEYLYGRLLIFNNLDGDEVSAGVWKATLQGFQDEADRAFQISSKEFLDTRLQMITLSRFTRGLDFSKLSKKRELGPWLLGFMSFFVLAGLSFSIFSF